MFAQQLIQAPMERGAGGRRQIRRRDPHRRLSIAFAFAHRHVRIVVRALAARHGRVVHKARYNKKRQPKLPLLLSILVDGRRLELPTSALRTPPKRRRK